MLFILTIYTIFHWSSDRSEVFFERLFGWISLNDPCFSSSRMYCWAKIWPIVFKCKKYLISFLFCTDFMQNNVQIHLTWRDLWLVLKSTYLTFVIHHKVSGLNISITVWSRITKFYRNIHTDLLYSHTRYGMSNYIRSEVIVKNSWKRSIWWLHVEFLENGLSEDDKILHSHFYRGQLATQTCWI